MANILITGSSRGIGLEFVKQLTETTKTVSHIFALCRDPSNAKVLQDFAQKHSDVHVLKCNVADTDQHKEVVQHVQQHVGKGGFNLLINNAGVLARDTVATVTENNLIQSFKVNAMAPLLFTKAFLPLLSLGDVNHTPSRVGKSMVINISSQLGSIEESNGGYTSYRLSKAALNMATKSLSVELKTSEIFVMALHPGWVKTEMGGPDAWHTTEESVERMLNVIYSAQETHRGLLLNCKGRIIPW